MNHNCPGIKKKKSIVGHKEVVNFSKIYLFTATYSIFWPKRGRYWLFASDQKKRTELQNPLLVITIWNGRIIETLKQILSPSAANIAEKVLQKIMLC